MLNFSALKGLIGLGGDPLSAAKAQAAKAGIAPQTLDDIAKGMKDIAVMATSEAEKVAAMKALFVSKGFPAEAVDMALKMMGKFTK
jgi:hypothetical protein